MENIQAVRRVQFAAGHRVHQHESKCRNLHGHNYVAYFHAEKQDGLDAIGRVIDFGVLKEKLGGWIDENWDHGFLVWKDDEEAIKALNALPMQKIYLTNLNPTAENLAWELLNDVSPRVLEGTGVSLTKVVLWETENCFVEANRDAR